MIHLFNFPTLTADFINYVLKKQTICYVKILRRFCVILFPLQWMFSDATHGNTKWTRLVAVRVCTSIKATVASHNKHNTKELLDFQLLRGKSFFFLPIFFLGGWKASQNALRQMCRGHHAPSKAAMLIPRRSPKSSPSPQKSPPSSS